MGDGGDRGHMGKTWETVETGDTWETGDTGATGEKGDIGLTWSTALRRSSQKWVRSVTPKSFKMF